MFKEYLLNKLKESTNNFMEHINNLLVEGNMRAHILDTERHKEYMKKLDNNFFPMLARFPLFYKEHWLIVNYDPKTDTITGTFKDRVWDSEKNAHSLVKPSDDDKSIGEKKITITPEELVEILNLPENEWALERIQSLYKISIKTLEEYLLGIELTRNAKKDEQIGKTLDLYDNNTIRKLIDLFDDKYKYNEANYTDKDIMLVGNALGIDNLERVPRRLEDKLYNAYFVNNVTDMNDLKRMFKAFLKKDETPVNTADNVEADVRKYLSKLGA